jgi:hypothetical protein
MLRDNVGKKLIFEAGNFVFQPKFALLQARQAQLIPLLRGLKRYDGFVEISMLLFQLGKGMPQLAAVLSVHQTPGMTLVNAWSGKFADFLA